MSSDLGKLKPQQLWGYFDSILRIPRKSKAEAMAREFVSLVANECGHPFQTDGAGNLVIKVPATPGYESAPTVILQGHLDMVCEKTAESSHDFATDPIRARIDGDWVVADETTLGADNGIAIAACLSLLWSQSKHGPLEILLTVDEETGMTGANNLDGRMLSGKLLINLDSEEESVITIGSAGGRGVRFEVPMVRDASSELSDAWQITCTGPGGHSGVTIHEEAANPIKLVAALVLALGDKASVVDFRGGSAVNAIPREATAVVRAEADAAEQLARFGRIFQQIKGVDVAITPVLDRRASLAASSGRALLSLIERLRHGVVGYCKDLPGLVETSQNVAQVEVSDDSATVHISTRGSVKRDLDRLVEESVEIGRSLGAFVETDRGYPGWEPTTRSPLLQTAMAVHERLFGRPPELQTVHAGLECGILCSKIPGLDVISIGPTIRKAHEPGECVRISSVGRMLDEYLSALLAALAEGPAASPETGSGRRTGLQT